MGQIKKMQKAVRDFVEARDWAQFHTPKNISMSIAIEAAELMEHFLWHEGQQSFDALDNPKKHQEIAEELADIIHVFRG